MDGEQDQEQQERWLPAEPGECRRRAEDTSQDAAERLTWGLLAVAGELAQIRRDLHRQTRKR